MKNSLRVLVVGSTLGLAPAAQAQLPDAAWYVGLSVGQSKANVSDSSVAISGPFPLTEVSKEESDTAYKVIVGYRFNRVFALEGGYTDFGTFSATGGTVSGTARTTVKSSGFHVDALGIFPVTPKWQLFGKIGTIYTTTKASFQGFGSVTAVSSGGKDSELDFKAGVGTEYSFSSHLGVRLEYEDHFGVGNTQTNLGDIAVVSVGVTYRF